VTVELAVDPHPLLDLYAFETTFPRPIAEIESPAWLVGALALDAESPFAFDDGVRTDVRDVLRTAGYKPTGRGKPASEYLRRAAAEGKLGPINLPVDACNVVSLHSVLPISVVDLELVRPPLHVAIAAADATFVFNASGQEIRVGGLLCLHDADGPCANAVKDSQRTKTRPETTRTLSLIWGAKAHAERTERAGDWYRELLERVGATTRRVEP
jgi:DNA/RNA-binding domain of Phe-tRNA-synthetase-like protein